MERAQRSLIQIWSERDSLSIPISSKERSDILLSSEKKSVFSLSCLLLIKDRLYHLFGVRGGGYVLDGVCIQAFTEGDIYKNKRKKS